MKDKSIESTNRRSFIKKGIGFSAATVASSLFVSKSVVADAYLENYADLDQWYSGEDYWKEIRKMFVLEKDSVYMNIGTTGSMPRSVLKEYSQNNKLVATTPWGNGGLSTVNNMAKSIASGFGAEEDEIVLSRNTTDGMCSIISGLNFKHGDVILTTHQEHNGGLSPLHVAVERCGAELVEVDMPVYTGKNKLKANDIIKAFRKALQSHSNVRLMVFSHIPYVSGVTLPAKELCDLAKKHNVPTLIDGAHTIGMMNLNFKDIDCDFYAGSGHKWQCGPGASGILYVRDNASRLKEYWSDREHVFWPVNSSSANSTTATIQSQLQGIGNDNIPAKQALTDSCFLWGEIGRQKIEDRVLELSSLCKEQLKEAFPDAYYFAPNDKDLLSGITTINPFNLNDIELLTIFRDRLRDELGFTIRTTSFRLYQSDTEQSHALRISTHLFHSKSDVIRLVQAMKQVYISM